MNDNHKQLNLFNFGKERKVIHKPVRLIELFAGIGATHKAIELMCKLANIPFESWKIVEWAIPSIKAYNAIHFKDYKDYSNGKSKEEMLERINGVSANYNEPISFEKLNKMPISKIKDIYNNVVATHNLVDVMKVKGGDLEVKDTDKFEYIMTYSFPCQ